MWLRVPNGSDPCQFQPIAALSWRDVRQNRPTMLLNKRADAMGGIWPMKGIGKKNFWTLELVRVIEDVNRDKALFKNQYKGVKTWCRKQVISRGKRLMAQKYWTQRTTVHRTQKTNKDLVNAFWTTCTKPTQFVIVLVNATITYFY